MYRMYVSTKQADNPQLQREATQQDFSLRRLLRRCRRRKWNENPLKSFSNFTSLSVYLSLSVHMPEEPVWGRDLSWDRTRSRCCYCCCCCWTHKNVVASTCFVLSRILFLLSQATPPFFFVFFCLLLLLTCSKLMVKLTSLNFMPRDKGGLCHQASVPSIAFSGGWFFSGILGSQ